MVLAVARRRAFTLNDRRTLRRPDDPGVTVTLSRAVKTLLGLALCLAAVATVPALVGAKPFRFAGRIRGLPTTKNHLVTPNVGAGGLRLGERLMPFPKGWRNPTECDPVGGETDCLWIDSTQSVKQAAKQLIGGSILVSAYHNHVTSIVLYMTPSLKTPTLIRLWQTKQHFGLDQPLRVLATLYPGITDGVELWGPGHRTITSFLSTKTGLTWANEIRIEACNRHHACAHI
jgi:hypothetical protein